MMVDLDAIEQRLAAIPASPWQWWMSEEPPFEVGNATEPHLGLRADTIMLAEFAASARQDIPALIREVRSLREFAASVQQEGAGRLD